MNRLMSRRMRLLWWLHMRTRLPDALRQRAGRAWMDAYMAWKRAGYPE